MIKKNSFSATLINYFGSRFRDEIATFLKSKEFLRDNDILEEEAPSLEKIEFSFIDVLSTDNTTVRFHINISLIHKIKGLENRSACELIGKWDIAKKEKGLTIEEIASEMIIPKKECNYGDDLVPIISKYEYPKIAKLFMEKAFHGEESNKEGILLAIDIADKLNLNRINCSLPNTCTGCIIMADTNMEIISNNQKIQGVKAGTILIDQAKAAIMSSSLLETTIIHECFHWVFHRCAFELSRLSNYTETGFVCKTDNTVEGSSATGNKFIEIQTLAVVPYILVNDKTLEKEVNDQIQWHKNSGLNKIQVLESVLCDIKNFHNFSFDTARSRLVNLGYTAFRGIKIYQDGGYIHSYYVAKDSLQKNETFRITRKGISKLYHNNHEIKELIDCGIFVYCDGHLVINDPKYLNFKNKYKPEITDYGYLHGDECFIKFKKCQKDCFVESTPVYGYNRVPEDMKDTYDAIYNANEYSERIEARKKWNDYIKRWKDCESRTFAQTFSNIIEEFHINKNFMDGAGVSADQISRICKGENRPRLATLIVFAAKVDMPYEVFMWFIEKAGFDFYESEGIILQSMELMDDRSIFKNLSNYNDYMKKNGYQPLLKD